MSVLNWLLAGCDIDKMQAQRDEATHWPVFMETLTQGNDLWWFRNGMQFEYD
jgi:hypothetical protein